MIRELTLSGLSNADSWRDDAQVQAIAGAYLVQAADTAGNATICLYGDAMEKTTPQANTCVKMHSDRHIHLAERAKLHHTQSCLSTMSWEGLSRSSTRPVFVDRRDVNTILIC